MARGLKKQLLGANHSAKALKAEGTTFGMWRGDFPRFFLGAERWNGIIMWVILNGLFVITLFNNFARAGFNWIGVIASVIFSYHIYAHTALVFANPGVALSSHPDCEGHQEAHCIQCDIYKPTSTVHCSYCNVCVAWYDHHCVFLGKCVGALTMNHFNTFCCTVCILLVWCACEVPYYVQNDEIQE